MTEQEKTDRCRLNEINGIDAWCTGDKCIYWRLLESQQDIEDENEIGCGIQHFGLIDQLEADTASWLLSMKKRLEQITPETGKARIHFKRREK